MENTSARMEVVWATTQDPSYGENQGQMASMLSINSFTKVHKLSFQIMLCAYPYVIHHEHIPEHLVPQKIWVLSGIQC